MTQEEMQTILSWQGGVFVEHTDAVSGVSFPAATRTIGKVNFHPDNEHFLLAYNLHLSFQAFAAGAAAGNQTATAHRMGADYEVYDANGEVYRALVWEEWTQIAALLTAVATIQTKLATPEAKAAMVERWKIATGQIPGPPDPPE